MFKIKLSPIIMVVYLDYTRTVSGFFCDPFLARFAHVSGHSAGRLIIPLGVRFGFRLCENVHLWRLLCPSAMPAADGIENFHRHLRHPHLGRLMIVAGSVA